MRTSRAALALPAALLIAAPSALPAQNPARGPGAPGPDGFWRWALAEVRGAGEASAAARTAPGAGPSTGWERVRLDAPGINLGTPGRRDGRVGASDLRALLGTRALEELLLRAGHQSTSVRFLNGRWQLTAGPIGARILQIRVVDRPLAEVNDLDGDGRVDAVLVYRPDGTMMWR